MVGNKLEKSGAFLFPDVSQISAMIVNFPDILASLGQSGNSKIPDCLGFLQHNYEKQAYITIYIHV